MNSRRQLETVAIRQIFRDNPDTTYTAKDISEHVDYTPQHIGKIITARLNSEVEVVGTERVGRNWHARKRYRLKKFV